MVEQFHGKEEVISSILVMGTKFNFYRKIFFKMIVKKTKKIKPKIGK